MGSAVGGGFPWTSISVENVAEVDFSHVCLALHHAASFTSPPDGNKFDCLGSACSYFRV